MSCSDLQQAIRLPQPRNRNPKLKWLQPLATRLDHRLFRALLPETRLVRPQLLQQPLGTRSDLLNLGLGPCLLHKPSDHRHGHCLCLLSLLLIRQGTRSGQQRRDPRARRDLPNQRKPLLDLSQFNAGQQNQPTGVMMLMRLPSRDCCQCCGNNYCPFRPGLSASARRWAEERPSYSGKAGNRGGLLWMEPSCGTITMPRRQQQGGDVRGSRARVDGTRSSGHLCNKSTPLSAPWHSVLSAATARKRTFSSRTRQQRMCSSAPFVVQSPCSASLLQEIHGQTQF